MRDDGAALAALRRHVGITDWAELVHLIPAAGVLVVWIVLMPSAGGFDADAWLPAGLALTALLVLAVAGGGRVLPTSRPARIALLGFAAFVAWNLLSLLWSDARG